MCNIYCLGVIYVSISLSFGANSFCLVLLF